MKPRDRTRRPTWGVLASAIAGLIGGVLLFAVPVMAGVGDELIVGVLNKGNKTTTLDGTVDGPLFKVFNHQGGGSAAVRINSDGPPFATNSTKRVLNFNADLLDGQHGTDYRPLTASGFAADPPNVSGDVVTVPIDVPTDGFLIVEATMAVFATATFDDLVICSLRVDGGLVFGTDQGVTVDGDTAIDSAVCPTLLQWPVEAGVHTVALAASGVDTADLRESNLQVMFIPNG